MAVIRPSFPGVYVQEIGPASTAITSAPTSLTGFLGRTLLGPVDTATIVSSFQDFTNQFGGLAVDLPLTYAVSQFFTNGGAQAIIGRLFEGFLSDSTPPSSSASLNLPGGLTLVAASPGAWGNHLTATIDTTGITPATAAQFQQYGLTAADLFNLTLTFEPIAGQVIASERYVNLASTTSGAAATNPNRIDRVLASKSKLCRVLSTAGTTPSPATATAIGGQDSAPLTAATILGNESLNTGLYLFNQVEDLNLLCIPPDIRLTATPAPQVDLSPAIRNAASTYCVSRRAIFLVDPPATWQQAAIIDNLKQADIDALGITGADASGNIIARNAALYLPNILFADPLNNNQPLPFAPCGAVAGIIAATDMAQGVWKAPAGVNAAINGSIGLPVSLNDQQTGIITPLGINTIRTFPTFGTVIWGARSLRGADAFDDDYKYLPVRRLILFIEDSISANMRWAVFEPNNEALWSSLRLSISSFLQDLYRQGAFYNFNVRCDSTTTTPTDIQNGFANIQIELAPVKPEEFLVLQFKITAGVPSA